jgi:ribosomal-protein-alanine N-acetyltransferase
MRPLRITTERLELIAGTPAMAHAELADPAALGPLLSARVPPSWPPDLYDPQAIYFSLSRMEEHPDAPGWWLWYLVRHAEPDGREVIGIGGFKGPPSEDGTVEIGYSILPEFQRRGYATEAVRGFVTHAFTAREVRRVIAETLPELRSSIGVLRKAGFTFVGKGSEPGVIRFELSR